MVGNTIPALDWDSFLHRFDVYKKLAGITGDAGNHFLDCLSKEVYSILFGTYGDGVTSKYEDHYTGADYERHLNSSIMQCGMPMIVGEIVGAGPSNGHAIANRVCRQVSLLDP